MRFLSLRLRLMLIVLALFVATGALTLWVVDRIARELIEALADRFAARQVLLDRERLLVPIMTEVALARQMAASPLLRSWARAEHNPDLKRFALAELDSYRKLFRDGSWFFVIDASKHYYYNDRDNRYRGRELTHKLSPDNPNDSWYFGLARQNVRYQLNPDVNAVLGTTKVWINVPMRAEDGRLLAIVGSGIDITEFLRWLVREREGVRYAMLINGAGAIQAHPDPSRIALNAANRGAAHEQTLFAQLANEDERRALRAAMHWLAQQSAESTKNLRLTLDGRPQRIAMAHLPDFGWYALTVIDHEVLLGQQLAKPFLTVFALAAMVLLVILAWLLDRMVLKRLAALSAGVTAVGNGDYSARVAIGGQDEIARLADAFNQMASQLAAHTGALEAQVAARTEALAQALATAEQATHAKNAYLARISHELRPPLDELLGRLQLLAAGPLDAEQQSNLHAIDATASDLLARLDALIDFARLEADALEIVAQPFALDELLEHLALRYTPRAAAPSRHYRQTCAPDVPLHLVGDAKRIQQVAQSLLDNAFENTATGEIHLAVTCEARPGDDVVVLRFTVRDSGCGIALDDQRELFKPFTAFAGPDGLPPSGRGLGLALAKRLVEKMGGTIGLVSLPGQGTTVWFTLRLGLAAD